MVATAKQDKVDAKSLVRSTEAGVLRGICEDGICRFLGVPYAAPPVGENRFREPQPVKPWPGERAATDPGPTAPHRIKDFPEIDVVPLVGTGSEGGEDYLTLNVWAPRDADKRPVMVFIHGGGFVVGSEDAPVHDGSAFAKSGLVCVAINYRLGIDGFPQAWKTRQTEEERRDILERHRNLAKAIANRDPDEAERWMSMHFDESIGALLR